MFVQIRKDLRDNIFTTESGIVIDSHIVYCGKYDENDLFMIYINDSWHHIEGIDFEIYPIGTFKLTDCLGNNEREFYGDIWFLQQIFDNQMDCRDATMNDDFYEWCCKYVPRTTI